MPIDLDAAAASLHEARVRRCAIEPLSDAHPDLTVEQAYAVQTRLVARLLDDGDRVVGHKLGLTSAAMRASLGVDDPDYGALLASTVHDDGATIAMAGLLQPRVEAEIALVLARPLRGPGVTPADVADATAGAVAALEVVDSRVVDWRIRLVDTIADLASAAAVVLGADVVPLDGLDLAAVRMRIDRDGEQVDDGLGAAALGDPLAAGAWLANVLGERGVGLDEGHLVLTGALHAAFDVAAGDEVGAAFDGLGTVACRFA